MKPRTVRTRGAERSDGTGGDVRDSRGRDAAVTALSAMRDSLYDVSIVRVEAVSPTEALVHGVARLPARPHGHSYGTICWRIELRDGMLWRSRIVS